MAPYQPPPAPGTGDRTQVVGGHSDADKTQIVPGQGDADRTQAVGGWQTARPGGPDADRTQVVPGVPPQAYVGGQGPRPAPGPGQGPYTPPPGFPPPPGWQQEEDLSPPWAGSVFPPLAPPGSPDWVRQGPEVFEEPGSGSGKKILLIALVVVVLAGLGVGLYFLVLNRDDGGEPGTPPVAQSTGNGPAKTTKPPATTKPRNPDPIQALLEDMPKPPASLQQDAKVLDLAQLTQLGLMDPPEVQALEAVGVTKVPYKSAVRKAPEDGPTPDALSAMVIPMKTEAEAVKLIEDLRKYQESVGYKHIAEPLPNMPPQVVFEKAFPPDGKSVYRGLYASGKNVIRITTIQAPLTNEASLSGSYRNHTEAMLRVFPAK